MWIGVIYGVCYGSVWLLPFFNFFVCKNVVFLANVFFFTFLLLHSFGSLVFSFQLILSCSYRTPKHPKGELSFPIFSKFFYNSFQYKFNYNSFSFNITNCLKLQKTLNLRGEKKKYQRKPFMSNKIKSLLCSCFIYPCISMKYPIILCFVLFCVCFWSFFHGRHSYSKV